MANRLVFMQSMATKFASNYLLPCARWSAGFLLCVAVAALIPKANTTGFIRSLGMCTQFLGVALIVYGIAETRRFFGKPGFWNTIANFFKDFAAIFIKPSIISASANIVIPGVTMKMHASTPMINPTIQQQIDELRKRADNFEAATESRFREISKEIANQIEAERNERIFEGQKISNQIETVAVGSAALQAGGAIYIMIGVVLTSIPDEIITWLPRLKSLVLNG